jgi:hypothetical protein
MSGVRERGGLAHHVSSATAAKLDACFARDLRVVDDINRYLDQFER